MKDLTLQNIIHNNTETYNFSLFNNLSIMKLCTHNIKYFNFLDIYWSVFAQYLHLSGPITFISRNILFRHTHPWCIDNANFRHHHRINLNVNPNFLDIIFGYPSMN